MSKRFTTAPVWYRPLLQAEDYALKKIRPRLNKQQDTNTIVEKTSNYQINETTGARIAERMVPGANDLPYVVQHVYRYVWAMERCRGLNTVDLGSGDGYGSFLLSWVAKNVVAYDLDQSAITEALKKYPTVDFRQANLLEVQKFPDSDIAVCFEVLEHIPESFRLLQTTGQEVPRLLLSVPNPLAGGTHLNPHHVNDWPLHQLKRYLKEAGAVSIDMYHQGFKDFRVRRGAHNWNPVWIADVTFAA